MVHAGTLPLEERVSRGGISPQPLTSFTDFFLDIFSRERRLLREMAYNQLHGKLTEAADCAIGLGRHGEAFTFYNQAIARGDRLANLYAAELAESLSEYEQALKYRLQMEDFAGAALNATRLGHPDEANEYWRRLREG